MTIILGTLEWSEVEATGCAPPPRYHNYTGDVMYIYTNM